MTAQTSALDAEAQRAFEIASERGGCVDRDVDIAGLHVRVRCAGELLAATLTAALAHLPAAGGPVDLTVHAWDLTNGAPGPAFPTDATVATDDGPVGRRYFLQHGGLRAMHQPSFGTLSMLDSDSNTGWFWCRSVADLPFWEQAAPFRFILHWWLSDRGVWLLHGGAVGTDAGGALLVGRGGSGKSTTSLLCLLDGMRYASDDYTLVRPEPTPTVYSLYNSGKVDGGQLEQLPALTAAVINADKLDTEKAVIFVHAWKPELTVASLPLRVLLCPAVTGRPDTSVTRISGAAALAALAPSTILQLSGARPGRDLTAMAALVRRVPTYRLELGTDLQQIPAVIRRLLDDEKPTP